MDCIIALVVINCLCYYPQNYVKMLTDSFLNDDSGVSLQWTHWMDSIFIHRYRYKIYNTEITIEEVVKRKLIYFINRWVFASLNATNYQCQHQQHDTTSFIPVSTPSILCPIVDRIIKTEKKPNMI